MQLFHRSGQKARAFADDGLGVEAGGLGTGGGASLASAGNGQIVASQGPQFRFPSPQIDGAGARKLARGARS